MTFYWFCYAKPLIIKWEQEKKSNINNPKVKCLCFVLMKCIKTFLLPSPVWLHRNWRTEDDSFYTALLQNHYPLKAPTIIHPVCLLLRQRLYLGSPNWPQRWLTHTHTSLVGCSTSWFGENSPIMCLLP